MKNNTTRNALIIGGGAAVALYMIGQAKGEPPITPPVIPPVVPPVTPPVTPPPNVCSPNWQVGQWGVCVNGVQNRSVTDTNNCRSDTGRPASTQYCFTPPPATTTGSVNVTSQPSGAEIIVDGVDQMQKTPYTIANLSSGVHTVTVRLSGYKDTTDTVYVEAGYSATLSLFMISSCNPNWNFVPGDCQPDGTRIVTYTDANSCELGYVATEPCAYVPPCTPNYTPGNWGPCIDGMRSRIETDINSCGLSENNQRTTFEGCSAITPTSSWSIATQVFHDGFNPKRDITGMVYLRDELGDGNIVMVWVLDTPWSFTGKPIYYGLPGDIPATWVNEETGDERIAVIRGDMVYLDTGLTGGYGEIALPISEVNIISQDPGKTTQIRYIIKITYAATDGSTPIGTTVNNLRLPALGYGTIQGWNGIYYAVYFPAFGTTGNELPTDLAIV